MRVNSLKEYLILVITLCLFFSPMNVFAEEKLAEDIACNTKSIDVTVCDTGCDYDDIGVLLEEVDNYTDRCNLNDLIINIKSGTYEVHYNHIKYIDNLIINGDDKNSTSVIFDNYFEIISATSVSISNLKISVLNGDAVLGVFDSKTLSLDNLLINATNTETGIYLNSIDQAKIDNVLVNGASLFGVYNNSCYRQINSPKAGDFPPSSYSNMLYINNSDISDNKCSVFDGCYQKNKSARKVSKYDNIPPIYDFTVDPSIEKNMVTYETDTTIISNSKLSCAVAHGINDSYYLPPSIYVMSNNTWSNKPVYDDNVIEIGDGRVIVDFEEDKIISINAIDLIDINSVFPETSGLEWSAEDDTIAKIENGRIVPLKVGNTVLKAANGRVNYRINLIVNDNLIDNPNTLNIGYVLIILVSIGVFGGFVYIKSYSK